MLSPAQESDPDDNLLPDDVNDIEKIGEDQGNSSDEGQEDTGANDDGEAVDDSEKKIVDPTVKRVRAPQPKLDSQRLKGPKGIQTIEKYFEGFKYHGKGHEKVDLSRIMKRLEHWSHRLYPKYQFDDCIEKIAKLGCKKDVQVYVKKIRLGMVDADDGVVRESMDVDEDEEKVEDSVPIDEFDALIAEQIEKQKLLTTPQRPSTAAMDTSLLNNSFDELMPRVSATGASTPGATASASKSEVELSEEMKERMERNRQIAIQKRLARIQAMEEEAKRKKVDQFQDNVVSSAIADPEKTKSPVAGSSSSELKKGPHQEDSDIHLALKSTQPQEVEDMNFQSTKEISQKHADSKSEKTKPQEDSDMNLEVENTRSQESTDNLQLIKKTFPEHTDSIPAKTKTQEDNNADLESKGKCGEIIDSDLEATLDEVISHKYRRNIQ